VHPLAYEHRHPHRFPCDPHRVRRAAGPPDHPGEVALPQPVTC